MTTTFEIALPVYTETYRDCFRLELIHDGAHGTWRTTVHRVDAPDYWQLEGPAGDPSYPLYVARTLADIAAAPSGPSPF